MFVLAGANEVIRAHKPSMTIEIGWWNVEAFWAWVDTNAYHVINLFQDSGHVRNYVLIPKF